MAKKIYKCWNCGKTFTENYKYLLHCDFHKGEPLVREAGCWCGQDWDIRSGKCHSCGAVHTAGWVVANA